LIIFTKLTLCKGYLLVLNGGIGHAFEFRGH